MEQMSQLGSSLMNPNISGQAFTTTIHSTLSNHFGVAGRFQISDNLWQIDSVTQIDATPLIARLGFYYKPFTFKDSNKVDSTKNESQNKIDFSINAYYTHRVIIGEFGKTTQVIEGVNVVPQGYNGLDVSVNMYLNAVHMFVQYSHNLNEAYNIPGFTGSQVIFGINVSGEFINLL